MKKLNKIAIFMFIALLCCCTSFIFVGCDIGKKNELTQSKIELIQPFKTQYYLNEELDTTNGILQYIDENGNKTSVEVTNSMVSTFSTTTLGKRKMIITYKDCTFELSYRVNPYDVEMNVYYHASSTFNSYFIQFVNATTILITTTSSSVTDLNQLNSDNSVSYDWLVKKTIDENGFIQYTDNITGTQILIITNITKDSFTLKRASGSGIYESLAFTKIN